MHYAIVLSGGIGLRLGYEKPKQYLEIENKPIIGYCLDVFQNADCIDRIVIVIAKEWEKLVRTYIDNNGITKFISFATAGESRQQSVLSGLEAIRSIGGKPDDLIAIHDAARPCVSNRTIQKCFEMLERYDMSMPVISVKDTVYYSENGVEISSLLNRDNLYAGQTPEGCHLGEYYTLNASLSKEDLSNIRGTSELGYRNGLTVGLFQGEETNIKITTKEDLARFVQILGDCK
jgi:2-C-methyl-D-erythritol 4-phosphate cytidylyltransferase